MTNTPVSGQIIFAGKYVVATLRETLIIMTPCQRLTFVSGINQLRW
jgi:hypothetical protein